MPDRDLNRLASLIRSDSDAILTRWRELVRQIPSAKGLDVPTLNDHLPGLLEELAVALEGSSDETIAEALQEGSPLDHGRQRVVDDFDIAEVVAEYNILRGCVHDLAEEHGLTLQGKAFHILNRVLDGAIGIAVETYAAQRASDVKDRREEYLAFVAHDLRTPLGAMSLAARLLETRLPAGNGSDECSRMVKTIQRNARHIDVLVGLVLEENSNAEAESDPRLQQRPFELWPMVEGIIQDIQPAAEGAPGPKLINEVPDDFSVFADAGQLRRVLQNLIGNAIKYTPKGEVRIGARKRDPDGLAECWVSDTGAGMPRDVLDQVFVKGVGDPEKEGSLGLGLAIVKSLVEAHGGTVHAESEEGRGSTFRFVLPNKPVAATRPAGR